MNKRKIPYSLVLAMLSSLIIAAGVCAQDIESTMVANNQFTFELYSQYRSQQGNIFFSPFSISSALAMTYEGARGTTADEMQAVLHFPKDDIQRRAAFAKLYSQINKKDKPYQLSTANALWAQKDYPFLEEYFSLIEQYYSGIAKNLDFQKDTEGSRLTINTWVEEETNHKIRDLIPAGYIDTMTRLVLTNAIYFKGEWLKQFNKECTTLEDFRISADRTVKAPMMSLTGKEVEFNYSETDTVQILELPYSGEELSMLVMLPKDDNMAVLEEALNTQTLSEWTSGLKKQRVDVHLPKFKFETKYFMAETLAKMGMPTAFSQEADFSGMTDKKDLYISQVIHQAFVEVNEEGTEAAAATAVVTKELAMPQPRIKVFRADHPFIFLIQEEETGNILFLGRVSDPTSA